MQEDSNETDEELEQRFNFSRRIHHERLLFADSDLLIATSPPQADLLASDYDVPLSKVRMIPPGYDDNRFFPMSEASRQAARERFGMKGKVIMSLGRLARNKGFDLLVDAFSVVAAREPNTMLRLAVGAESSDRGDNDMMQELEDKVKGYGLQDRVQISTSISDDDLPDFYRAADVFALSSRYEPFGMTAVEAMACGTPTVITTHDGHE